MTTTHQPVLLAEVLHGLQLRPGDTVIDGTLGGGGHTQALLQQVLPGGRVIGFDQDPAAIHHIRSSLGRRYTSDQLLVIHDNFQNVRQYCQQAQAILLDLGMSNDQLVQAGRGFSFRASSEPLDLRMNPQSPPTAADLLNTLSQAELQRLFQDYGEVHQAKTLARAVCHARQHHPLKTVADLRQVIGTANSDRLAPIWQALRIAVNRELEVLATTLTDAISILSPGGRLAVITFHSLEDRIVKHQFRKLAKACVCPPEFPTCQCGQRPVIQLLTPRPLRPQPEAVRQNPQARSAKLRLIEKL